MLQKLDNDKLIKTRFCLWHIYSLIILWLFIYVCRYILLISVDSLQCITCVGIVIVSYGYSWSFDGMVLKNETLYIIFNIIFQIWLTIIFIIIFYIISHGSILCSLYKYFINCRFTVAISNCTPLGTTWWETFHCGLTCVKRLTTGELAPNEALSNNIIVRYWIIWSTIWAWPNVDWTVTILSDYSLFIWGHYVSWDSYIYYPLFKNVSLFGWIHRCTTMLYFSVGLNSFFIQITRHCLKAISYNGVSLRQRFYFLPIHNSSFSTRFDHFLWCISILFRIYYYDYISRLLTYGSPLMNQFWIFLFKTQLNSHTYYLHFHNFYFIDYCCYYTYICYFLNNLYHK